MNFSILVNTIRETHTSLQQSALKSVNKHLTIRNWLVGFYIVEFEQNGEDRAKYGEKLLDKLSESIDIKGLGARNLKLFRQFYFSYPQIMQTVSAQLQQLGLLLIQFVRCRLTNSKTMKIKRLQLCRRRLHNSRAIYQLICKCHQINLSVGCHSLISHCYYP